MFVLWEYKAYLNSCTPIRHLLQLIRKPDPFSLHNGIIKWSPMKLFEAMNCISYIRDYLSIVNTFIYQLLNECKINIMLYFKTNNSTHLSLELHTIIHLSGLQLLVKLYNKNVCTLLVPEWLSWMSVWLSWFWFRLWS